MALALPGPRRPASIRCDRPARQFSRSITLPRLADASCVFSVPHGLERALDRASLLACRVVPQRSERYPNPEQTAADASQDCHARWHARVARSFAGEQPMVDRARRLAGLYAYVHHFLRRVYYMGHHRVLVHCYRFVHRCVHSSFVRSVSELLFFSVTIVPLTLNANGQGVGSVYLWLLPVVIGQSCLLFSLHLLNQNPHHCRLAPARSQVRLDASAPRRRSRQCRSICRLRPWAHPRQRGINRPRHLPRKEHRLRASRRAGKPANL